MLTRSTSLRQCRHEVLIFHCLIDQKMILLGLGMMLATHALHYSCRRPPCVCTHQARDDSKGFAPRSLHICWWSHCGSTDVHGRPGEVYKLRYKLRQATGSIYMRMLVRSFRHSAKNLSACDILSVKSTADGQRRKCLFDKITATIYLPTQAAEAEGKPKATTNSYLDTDTTPYSGASIFVKAFKRIIPS